MRATGLSRLLLSVWCAMAGPAFGQVEIVDERGTLRGIEGVMVLVERMDVAAEWRGLTSAALQTDVEERLRAAEIPILIEDGQPHPVLYVRIEVRAGRDKRRGVFAVTSLLQLSQAVTLARNPNLLGLATTWATHGALRIYEEEELPAVHESLRALTDRFAEAYRTANPPPSP